MARLLRLKHITNVPLTCDAVNNDCLPILLIPSRYVGMP